MSPYGPSTEKNALGGWALGLGIASLVCCGLLTGIPAMVLGFLGIQAANEGRASNKGMAIAGLIMGVLSIVWTVIVWTTDITDFIFSNL
jgi:integral membrane protein